MTKINNIYIIGKILFVFVEKKCYFCITILLQFVVTLKKYNNKWLERLLKQEQQQRFLINIICI